MGAGQATPSVLATGGGVGLTAEFPFYDDVPAVIHGVLDAGTKRGSPFVETVRVFAVIGRS